MCSKLFEIILLIIEVYTNNATHLLKHECKPKLSLSD